MHINNLHPFVQWAGGKGQLLSEIRQRLPKTIERYAEPFIGGGAVLFEVLKNYHPSAVFISDINKELITAYRVVRDSVESLIQRLSRFQEEYIPMSHEDRKAYYLERRDDYNRIKVDHGLNDVECAALLLFLNKTCFNALYRVNKSGLFNVPHGSYRNPTICDAENLRLASECLKHARIVHGNYTVSWPFVNRDTFVYMDPPYRPLKTGGFTAYTEYPFGDNEQKRLADYANYLNGIGAKVMLSNSDPKNTDPKDNFFEDIYPGFTIERVWASRAINRDAKGRGKITELLIRNY